MGRPADALLERASELEALSGALACAAAADGRLVLVEGPAGVGKSRLLDACGELGARRAMAVLRARGDELAMESSFSAVRELLWAQVLGGGGGVLEGAAGLAAPVFEGDTDGAAGPERASAVLHGLYWLVANLSEGTPLVLLVDDAHWLDPASVRFLAYLARRIDSLPVLMVAGLRRGEGSDPAGLMRVWSADAAVVLRPAPLSPDASAELVRGELGARADEELCRSCHDATGGNPFYLRALSAALRQESGRPTAAAAGRVRALGVGAVGRSVLVRLARLGEDCERLARALAVLAPCSPLRHAAMLAELERGRAECAADRLRGADLLAPGRELSFVHPIVREAVAAELLASQRAALHAKAAALLIEHGGPADRVAAHLLSAECYGEEWVVSALRAAARDALAQGAPEAAVSYLRRALAEPPALELRADVLLELGRAEALLPVAHDFTALREALRVADGAQRRAEIALELGRALTGVVRTAEVASLLSSALEHSEGVDPALRERIEADLIGAGAQDLTHTPSVLARAHAQFIRAGRGEVREPMMLAALAQTGAVGGLSAVDVVAFARRALADESLLERGPPHGGATIALCWCDQLEEAAREQDTAIADAQRRGSAPLFMQMCVWRAETALRAGELAVAEDLAQRAHELAGELGVGNFARMFFISVLLERARAKEALALLESVELGEQELALWQDVVVLAQRGRARIACGELEGGVADVLEAECRMATAGCHLGVVIDWVCAAALALAQLGRRGEALELAARELSDAVEFGAPRRHALALSVSGLLDPGERGLTLLRDAVELLADSPARLERARMLINLGAGLRERGRRNQARDPLLGGLDLAHRCGALTLVERARTELIRCGARPRRETLSGPEALTPAELRTARMAAGGLTNRAIAQALFVSTKAVEGQLSHAYAKLRIHSRAELARALGADERVAVA